MEIAFLPQWLLLRLCPAAESRWHWNVLLSHCLLFGFLASPLFSLISLLPHDCVVKRSLSVPCPGCGITTSVLHLLRGEWHASLSANFAGGILIVGMLLQCGLHGLSLGVRSLSSQCQVLSTRLNTWCLVSVAVSWSMRLIQLFT